MTTVQSIILSLFTGIAILGLVPVIRWAWRKNNEVAASNKVRHRLEGRSIIAMASKAYFFGLARNWDGQWKGYGVLVLTQSILYFLMWRRELDLMIPIDRIKAARIITEDGKKSLRRPHLQVDFLGRDGQLRTATWILDRSTQWIEEIERLLNRKIHHEAIETKHLSEDEDSSGIPIPLEQ